MNYYYRYHFYVIQGGKKIRFHVCANNIYSAYSKVNKLYPEAEKIQMLPYGKNMIELKNYCHPSFSSRWSLEDDTLLYYMEPKYVLILDYCCGALNIIELTEKEINESYNYEDFESFLETLEEKYGFRLKDCNWMTTESLSIYRYKNGKEVANV